MGLNEKSVNLATEALLRAGPSIFSRTVKLISDLFGDSLLFTIGEGDLRSIAGAATIRLCDTTRLYYVPTKFAHNLLLDRCIILCVQEWAERHIENYAVTTSPSDTLSEIVSRWVQRNASLPLNLEEERALERMDPCEWVDSFRILNQRKAEKKPLGDYEDSVLLFRELENGQLCLLHWYAEMIVKQNARLEAEYPGGVLIAAERLSGSIA